MGLFSHSTRRGTTSQLAINMSSKEQKTEVVVAEEEVDAKKDVVVKGTKRPAEDKNDDIKKMKKEEDLPEGEEDFDEEGEGEGEGDDDDDGEGEEDDDDAKTSTAWSGSTAHAKPAPVGIFFHLRFFNNQQHPNKTPTLFKKTKYLKKKKKIRQ